MVLQKFSGRSRDHGVNWGQISEIFDPELWNMSGHPYSPQINLILVSNGSLKPKRFESILKVEIT